MKPQKNLRVEVGGWWGGEREGRAPYSLPSSPIKTISMSTVYINTDPESFGPGTWNSITMMALLSRTESRIQSFIEMAVIQLVSLLCSDCSNHAFDFIKERHPNRYRHRVDSRGEKLGMWYWVFDLHNDVNKRLQAKYPNRRVLTLEEAEAIYAPVLALTTEQIESGMAAARSPSTMDDIPLIRFDNIDADDEVHVEEGAPAVPIPAPAAIPTPIASPEKKEKKEQTPQKGQTVEKKEQTPQKTQEPSLGEPEKKESSAATHPSLSTPGKRQPPIRRQYTSTVPRSAVPRVKTTSKCTSCGQS